MTKYAHHGDYPALAADAAERALLTAWASLHRYADDLVLVGGLAVRALTVPQDGVLPAPVTMDVDFGVSLGIEGGQYGTIAMDLAGQGFRADDHGRYASDVGNVTVYVDLLTEDPRRPTGATTMVDQVQAGVFPGLERAMATREFIPFRGVDLFGVEKEAEIPVAGIGALLVLKLNAFAGREQAKDAFDILVAVTRYRGGFREALTRFREEGAARNTAWDRAGDALRQHFQAPDASGPRRAATFVLGDGVGPGDELYDQIVQQTVTVGQALLQA